MSEIFISLKHDSKKLYLAKYSTDHGKIELSSLFMPVFNKPSIEHLIFLHSPTLIIVSAGISETIKKIREDIKTVVVPISEFSYDICKDLIIKKCFSGNEFLAITSLDFSCREFICCCGALVKFLESSHMRVYEIKYMNAFCMGVDFKTLQCLQIIKEDPHPSLIKGSGRAKEGFSMLALMDNTCTPQGKRKLKELLLQPFRYKDDIEARLDSISYFISNPSLVLDLCSTLKSFSDLEIIIKKYKENRQIATDWIKLLNSLKSFLHIQERLENYPNLILILESISKIDPYPIVNIIKVLENCLVIERDRPHVQRGVNEELDYYKKTYEEVEKFLQQLIEIEKKELASLKYSNLTILYLHGFGYVVEILFKESEFPEKFEAENYSFQFATEDCLYFKTLRTAILDEKFGDLENKIRDAENSIIIRIEEQIISQDETLSLISQSIAILDSLLSITQFSENFKLVRPIISETTTIQVVNGRHLLVEMCVDNFIPNDCALDFEHRIGVITGPNFSGKSVYMKTIGLIVYLSHIGCYVPAEYAEIGIFDQLFSRMHNSESHNISSFAEELSQLSIALNNCTEKSLILIDEFGKGTSPVDGICLFSSLVSEIEEDFKVTVLLTTHFEELFSYSMIKESNIVRFYTMQMAFSDNPVYLYKLIRGLPSESSGIICAKWAGIADDVIDRALEIKENLKKGDFNALHFVKRTREKVFELLRGFEDVEDCEEIFCKLIEIIKS